MVVKIRLSNNNIGVPFVEEMKFLMQTYDQHPTIDALKEELVWRIEHELMFDHLKETHPKIYKEMHDWLMTLDEVYET